MVGPFVLILGVFAGIRGLLVGSHVGVPLGAARLLVACKSHAVSDQPNWYYREWHPARADPKLPTLDVSMTAFESRGPTLRQGLSCRSPSGRDRVPEFLLVFEIVFRCPRAPGRLSYLPALRYGLCSSGGASVDRNLPARFHRKFGS